jgi:hypothetical protein
MLSFQTALLSKYTVWGWNEVEKRFPAVLCKEQNITGIKTDLHQKDHPNLLISKIIKFQPSCMLCMYFGRQVPMFWKNLVPSSSE